MNTRDTEPVAPPEGLETIPAGQARAALVAALADVARALGRLEALASAMARALDEAHEQPKPPEAP